MSTRTDLMSEYEYTSGNMNPELDVKFAFEKGKRFFPITHRKAIFGLSVNSLVMSESLDIEIKEADNTITINPIVEQKFIEINTSITELQQTINETINTAITNLTERMDNMLYAASDKPAGVANSAKKLASPITISLSKHASGSVSLDGSESVGIAVSLTGKYAASDMLGGAADSAKRLTNNFTFTLSGAVTGSVSLNGSSNVTLNTAVNHTHSQYSLTTHLHDDRYSLLSHNHDSVYSKLNHNHNSTYVNVTGDTMSGVLTVNNTVNANTYFCRGTSSLYLTRVASSAPPAAASTIWAW